MSDLFLDTDVRLHYPWTAKVSAGSPFSIDELTDIFRDEVAPNVEFNLFDVAGEWAMFGDEWIVKTVSAYIANNPPRPYAMKTSALSEWHAVAHLVSCLRLLPPAEWSTRVNTWRSLAKLYLDRNPGDPPPLPYTAEELNRIFNEEITPAYSPSAAGYNKHNPDMYPTPEQILSNFLRWIR